jgi:AcrR family transcriptional regulator
MATRRRSGARAGVTPDRIAEEAVRIVDSAGLAELSLLRVADALGVKTPSLYAHVDSLEHVEQLVRARALRALAERTQRAAVGRARREALVAIADAQRTFAREHPGLWACTARVDKTDLPEARAAAELTLEVVLAVVRGYGLAGDDALHAVRALRAATRGFIDLERAGGFGMPLKVDESWRRLLAMVDAGLEARTG